MKPDKTALLFSSPCLQVGPTHFILPRLLTLALGRCQSKVPGWGSGLLLGIHLWNWRSWQKQSRDDCHRRDHESPLHLFSTSSLCYPISIYLLFTFLYLISSLSSFPPTQFVVSCSCAAVVRGERLGCCSSDTEHDWFRSHKTGPDGNREQKVFSPSVGMRDGEKFTTWWKKHNKGEKESPGSQVIRKELKEEPHKAPTWPDLNTILACVTGGGATNTKYMVTFSRCARRVRRDTHWNRRLFNP